jgi:transcriptional/translational regulatory protein YebC/TACO1
MDAEHVRKALRLMDMLEDLDDVQRVTANVDISEEIMAELAG